MRGVPRRAAGDFQGAGLVDGHAENFRRALHDELQIVMRVELQPQHDAEARAQGRGEQSGAGRGADEGEWLDVHSVGASGRALPDHDVELVVFERGIQHFFERRLQAVDFVNEQDLLLAQVGEDGGEVAFDLQRRAGGLLKRTPSSLAMMVARVVLPSPGGP